MNHIELLHAVLDGKHISTVYQPIVSLQNGSVFAYEALSRITLASCPFGIETLFELSTDAKRLWELEKLCRTKALEHALHKPKHAKLFINVDADVMQESDFQAGFTRQKLEEHGIHSKDIIIEITEKNTVTSIESFASSIAHYRAQEFQIAVDDYGTGYSSVNRVCTFSPEFLKIDMSLVRNINNDPMKKSAVSSTLQFCKECGIQSIAEGIETAEELRTIISLGVDYGQGYYFAKPTPSFSKLSCNTAQEIESIYHEKHCTDSATILGRVQTIKQSNQVVKTSDMALSIFETMKRDSNVTEFFAIDVNKHVCGILTREYILERFGGQFGYNLSRKLTVEQIMQRDFLAVDANVSIEKVATTAMNRHVSNIYHAIAVTKHGKFMGSITVKDLLMSTVELQVRRASDSNPLTGLPGNTVIQEQIAYTFTLDTPWSIIYLDLDNFKAYNDAYGFTNGDLMIKTVARAMQESCNANDFIGHVGGDDFVIISQSNDVSTLCHRILYTFHASTRMLYHQSDWDNGYIVVHNRFREPQEFPITTLSIAVITSEALQHKTMEEFSIRIASAKETSKKHKGDCVNIVRDKQ